MFQLPSMFIIVTTWSDEVFTQNQWNRWNCVVDQKWNLLRIFWAPLQTYFKSLKKKILTIHFCDVWKPCIFSFQFQIIKMFMIQNIFQRENTSTRWWHFRYCGFISLNAFWLFFRYTTHQSKNDGHWLELHRRNRLVRL